MTYTRKNKGVCSLSTEVTLTDDGVIESVTVVGGCNGNLQVAAEVANTYRVPIQLLPSSLAPGLPAPAVFYGTQLIVADGKDFNGAASYQIVADVLDLESVPKQAKSGLLFQDGVRKDFDALKATIKAGGK